MKDYEYTVDFTLPMTLRVRSIEGKSSVEEGIKKLAADFMPILQARFEKELKSFAEKSNWRYGK